MRSVAAMARRAQAGALPVVKRQGSGKAFVDQSGGEIGAI